jgi:hypothetical protein
VCVKECEVFQFRTGGRTEGLKKAVTVNSSECKVNGCTSDDGFINFYCSSSCNDDCKEDEYS